jgi:uncharacterized protein HemX
MTAETDENGSGDPRSMLASPIIAGAGQFPNDLESIGDEVQSAPAATPAARGWKDALRAGTVVPVALGLVLGTAYLGYAHVQRQIKAQHAELQSLKDKIQAMAVAQTRIDVEQSQPSINEIQGLQNHVDTLRRAKQQKKEIRGLQNHVNTRVQPKQQKQ